MTPNPQSCSVQCWTPKGLHKLAYTQWGEADNPRVLICAHGLTRVGRDFDDLARALAPHYRVVCPDLPGRGASDWLSDPGLYILPTYVNDMVTLIARLAPQTLHWFGTSLGGMVGMALASLQHTPIARLVLNDIGPVLSGPALTRIATYVGQPVRFADLDQAEAYVRAVSAPFGPLTDAQWRHLTEIAVRHDQGAYVMHYDPSIALVFKSLVPADRPAEDVLLWDDYDKISCPTLSVRGETSDLLSAETQAAMAQRGPHAEVVVIPKTGHAPMFMSDEQIAIAQNFLLRNP